MTVLPRGQPKLTNKPLKKEMPATLSHAITAALKVKAKPKIEANGKNGRPTAKK
jgi:hypothetical protein